MKTKVLKLIMVISVISAVAICYEQLDGTFAVRANPSDNEGLTAFKSQGLSSSIAILPVVLQDTPTWQTAVQMALILERCGASDIDVLRSAAFDAGELTETASIIASLKQYISKTIDKKYNYYLYSKFTGDRMLGIETVSLIVIDGDGNEIWSRRLDQKDALFKAVAPYYPLHGAIVAIESLRRDLGWPDPLANENASGKWTEYCSGAFNAEFAKIRQKIRLLER